MPYKDKDKQRKADREYRARKRIVSKEKGLCLNCGNHKPEFGFADCNKCRSIKGKWSKDNKQKISEKRISEGRCQTCGRDKFGETQKNCMLCRRSKTERGDDNQWS